ncbi:MAG: YcgL domain-containing protein [Gammaproteobacteria bacterium]|nr:YcgL domain-containing protein [Gammaproteobacteria bacterium]
MSKELSCFIYRSDRKADTYLYLIEKDDFSQIPEELLKVFGEPEFSFQFQLTTERSLAKEDSAVVFENLKNQGFHLQIADDLLIEQQLALKILN